MWHDAKGDVVIPQRCHHANDAAISFVVLPSAAIRAGCTHPALDDPSTRGAAIRRIESTRRRTVSSHWGWRNGVDGQTAEEVEVVRRRRDRLAGSRISLAHGPPPVEPGTRTNIRRNSQERVSQRRYAPTPSRR